MEQLGHSLMIYLQSIGILKDNTVTPNPHAVGEFDFETIKKINGSNKGNDAALLANAMVEFSKAQASAMAESSKAQIEGIIQVIIVSMHLTLSK